MNVLILRPSSLRLLTNVQIITESDVFVHVYVVNVL